MIAQMSFLNLLTIGQIPPLYYPHFKMNENGYCEEQLYSDFVDTRELH